MKHEQGYEVNILNRDREKQENSVNTKLLSTLSSCNTQTTHILHQVMNESLLEKRGEISLSLRQPLLSQTYLY